MGELPQCPGVKEILPEARQVQDSVLAQPVPDRVLHEGVGDDDKVARQPRAQCQRDGRSEVFLGAEPPLAEQEQPGNPGRRSLADGRRVGEGVGVVRLLADGPVDAGQVLLQDHTHDTAVDGLLVVAGMLSVSPVDRRGPPSMPRTELGIHGLKSWGRNL